MSIVVIAGLLRQAAIPTIMVVGSTLLWPVILVAHHSHIVSELWYWAIVQLMERIWLSESDYEQLVKPRRLEMFEPLAHESRKKQSTGSALKVLEIGPGTGSNFCFFPPGLRLTTLDLNRKLKDMVDTVKANHPHIKIDDMLVGNAENMSDIPDNSFDAVIGIHILCCIKNKEAAAKEIFRVLKPVR
jgi:SAM-dependent methyltransferase